LPGVLLVSTKRHNLVRESDWALNAIG